MRGIRPKALLSIALLMPMPAIRPIAAPSIASIRVAPDLVVERPVFGVLVASEGGEEHFEASSRVPLTQGQAYGWVMKRDDDALTKRWITPALGNREIRRDATKFLLGMQRRHTLAAAKRFAEFERPVLIAWSREDRFFKVSFVRALASVTLGGIVIAAVSAGLGSAAG